MSRRQNTVQLNATPKRLAWSTRFLHLTKHESVPVLIDALLDLPPGREFNKTELAEHAGVTRQTVSNYIELLLYCRTKVR